MSCKRILFVGGGHAHCLAILAMLKDDTFVKYSAEIVMISNGRFTYYSGMIPGAVAKCDVVLIVDRLEFHQLAGFS
jgi:NADH dehydrogenase FAD-containing subunit